MENYSGSYSIDVESRSEKEAVSDHGTNDALAERDYSKKCKVKQRIALVAGYHIWWCETHRQPSRHCKYKREKQKRKEAESK